MVIVPTQFSFGKDLEIFVQMLNPVSYETVQAKLEDGTNKTIASGSLTLNSGECTFLIFPCICFRHRKFAKHTVFKDCVCLC